VRTARELQTILIFEIFNFRFEMNMTWNDERFAHGPDFGEFSRAEARVTADLIFSGSEA
jgi:hypothetical protein